jgi:hypothetical protein
VEMPMTRKPQDSAHLQERKAHALKNAAKCSLPVIWIMKLIFCDWFLEYSLPEKKKTLCRRKSLFQNYFNIG